MLEARHLIMDLAEEDEYGLWEFVWRTHGENLSASEAIALLREPMLALQRGGMLDLLLIGGDQPRLLLSHSEAREALFEQRYWTPSVAAERHVEAYATEKGKAAWDRGEFYGPA